MGRVQCMVQVRNSFGKLEEKEAFGTSTGKWKDIIKNGLKRMI
jgi:hypothetical protein